MFVCSYVASEDAEASRQASRQVKAVQVLPDFLNDCGSIATERSSMAEAGYPCSYSTSCRSRR